jgi:hypothetical protein
MNNYPSNSSQRNNQTTLNYHTSNPHNYSMLNSFANHYNQTTSTYNPQILPSIANAVANSIQNHHNLTLPPINTNLVTQPNHQLDLNHQLPNNLTPIRLTYAQVLTRKNSRQYPY